MIGGLNTLLTAIAFYLLVGVLPARAAFTIVYCAGLAFVVLVTPGFVFGSNVQALRRILLAGWYFCTYLVGVAVLSVLTSLASASRLFVVLGTVAVTAPLSFLGARFLVGGDYASSTGGSTPSG